MRISVRTLIRRVKKKSDSGSHVVGSGMLPLAGGGQRAGACTGGDAGDSGSHVVGSVACEGR